MAVDSASGSRGLTGGSPGGSPGRTGACWEALPAPAWFVAPPLSSRVLEVRTLTRVSAWSTHNCLPRCEVSVGLVPVERDASGCGLGSVLHLPTHPVSVKQSLFPHSLKNQRCDGHAGKLRQTKVMLEVAPRPWRCVVTSGAASRVALWANPRFFLPVPTGGAGTRIYGSLAISSRFSAS